MAPVLLTQALPDTQGLQAVLPSADGHLYVIDALSGLAQPRRAASCPGRWPPDGRKVLSGVTPVPARLDRP